MPITLNNNLSTMKVGEYVWCKYTATSGAVGTFSEFATKTDSDVVGQEIPVASTATPNGYFKFIMVEDWNGKKRLVADRNIQHSISWDTLNTSGIANGSGLPLDITSEEPTLENGFYRKKYAIRLLTGGINNADKNNEWDSYIVSSSLNNTISPSDNNVWNWNTGIYSWTSTTYATLNYRVKRGGINGGFTQNSGSESNLTSNFGFRPVLEEYVSEKLNINKTLILQNGEYKKWSKGSPATVGGNNIPIMTSNIAPSGTVTASSFYNVNSEPWKAFDGKENTAWYTSDKTFPQWISYEYPSPTIVEGYSMLTHAPSSMPNTWTFEAWNGTSWITLDSRSGITWSSLEKKTFTFANSMPYIKYRINVTSNNNSASYAVQLREIEFLGRGTPATSPSWQMVSSTLPTVNQFFDEGMDSLTPLFDRAVQNLNPQEMTLDSTFVGEGKLFRKSIDLNKYFDLRTITTEKRNS